MTATLSRDDLRAAWKAARLEDYTCMPTTPAEQAGLLLGMYTGIIGAKEHAEMFAKEEAAKGVSDFWATTVELLKNAK